MTKQEKEKIIVEFKKRMAEKPVIVNGSGWSIPLDEYMEQEKWARPVKPFIPEVIEKSEVSSEGLDEGIMSKESIFNVKLWYMRNRQNFDLSVRNSRRVRH